jgi:hypothetical protein
MIIRWWVPFVTAAIAAGCMRVDEAPLRRINSDAIAHLELGSGLLVRRHEQHAGRVLGKPRRAQVLMSFEAKPGVSLDSIQAEAQSRATQAGWVLAQNSSTFAEGTKDIDGSRIELTIYRDESRPEVVVLLRQL